MNLKEIKEMINLMNENNLMELELEKEGLRIRLKRSASGEVTTGPIVVEGRSVSGTASVRQTEEADEEFSAKNVEIKAPMVGTFYRSPSPEAPPYIEVGQTVETGQVICIIEAMKLMNEIKSEIRGRIIEILIDNAEPLEFGQSMFLIDPL